MQKDTEMIYGIISVTSHISSLDRLVRQVNAGVEQNVKVQIFVSVDTIDFPLQQYE